METPVIYAGATCIDPGQGVSNYFQSLATEIWREACQHIEISESTETIAAVLLKINPHTLRARMRKLRIDGTQFREHEPLP
jgi:hypothetical protein